MRLLAGVRGRPLDGAVASLRSRPAALQAAAPWSSSEEPSSSRQQRRLRWRTVARWFAPRFLALALTVPVGPLGALHGGFSATAATAGAPAIVALANGAA